MANAMGETKRVCGLFEGSRVIRGEGSVSSGYESTARGCHGG